MSEVAYNFPVKKGPTDPSYFLKHHEILVDMKENKNTKLLIFNKK